MTTRATVADKFREYGTLWQDRAGNFLFDYANGRHCRFTVKVRVINYEIKDRDSGKWDNFMSWPIERFIEDIDRIFESYVTQGVSPGG